MRPFRRRYNKTRGWNKQRPSYHERTLMLRRCGKKCFLGTKKRFPICKKHTCKISSQGLHAAYIRARQFGYKSIAKKAVQLLKK
jgi:hypothetical protein